MTVTMMAPAPPFYRLRHILLSLYLLFPSAISFVLPQSSSFPCRLLLHAESPLLYPVASLVGVMGGTIQEQQDHFEALQAVGYKSVTVESDDDVYTHRYSFVRSTGMLKLLNSPRKPFGDEKQQQQCTKTPEAFNAPRWVPIVRGFENILVQNGWSFLDPDENEKISAFQIDAANLEGLYKPKWGDDSNCQEDDFGPMSSLGFSLRRMTSEEIRMEVEDLGETAKGVLLSGNTDPYGAKQTHNGYNFRGSVRQEDIEQGLFVCAIGNLPLFTTLDLTMSTVRSGWLSFLRPVSDDHVMLLHPEKDAPDQRIEVLCAKSGCHLGHYFGKGNGYCINASAMNLIPSRRTLLDETCRVLPVVSWNTLQTNRLESSSAQLVSEVMFSVTSTQTLVFGAGCFWHIEYALRRLPGVVSTLVGYAGGTTTAPTYEEVCHRETAHAEVVQVTFDPTVLDPRILIDCFLALHDPTKVRAHGKHAQDTGQYRSCVFVTTDAMKSVVVAALLECQEQLKKELSTQVRRMDPRLESWFWPAEDRHQRHDEKRGGAELSTLSVLDWLREYGKRAEITWGSSQTFVTTSALTPT